jgi:hypothetical protein
MKQLKIMTAQSLLLGCLLHASIRTFAEDLAAGPQAVDQTVDAAVNVIPVLLEADPNVVEIVKPLIEGTQRTVAAKLLLVQLTGNLAETQTQSLKQFDQQWVYAQAWKSIHEIRRQDTPARRARGIKDDKEAFTQWLINLQQRQDGPSDSVAELVDKQLDQALAKVLTQEQITVYQAEQEAKLQFHRQASAQFFLALIRKQINVTDQQAEQLQSIIEKYYRKNLSWIAYIHNPKTLPALPKRAVAQVLTPEQRKAYEKIRQINFQHNT